MLLVVYMALTAIPAGASEHESTQLYVSADKTEASAGDTINFTITMGPVYQLGSVQMTLDIPEGLTYVAGSGKVADGLKATLGFDELDWTEESLMINGYALENDYESDTDTVIGSFQCTVNEGFSGQASVSLANLEFVSCEDFAFHTDRFTCAADIITVAGTAPSADPTAVSEGETTDSGTTGVSEDATESASEPSSQPAAADPTQQEATKDSSSPKTSDNGMLFVGFGLLAAALIVFGVSIIAKSGKKAD